MMGVDIARCLDPVLLARDCGIEPDPWQADLLRSDAPRSLLLCSRQSGKSTTTGLIALSTALYHRPGGLVIVVSPSQRQSAEMLRTITLMHSKLRGVPELSAESVLKAEMANGSRILALPGNERTVRGYAAADLIVIDEAARVDDELITAVRPMLATSNGRLIALTTPAGRRGWFFEAWTGEGDWNRVKVAADQCPRISQEFLDEELKALGAVRFSEEYGLEFRDSDEAVFPGAVIEAAFSAEVEPLWH